MGFLREVGCLVVRNHARGDLRRQIIINLLQGRQRGRVGVARRSEPKVRVAQTVGVQGLGGVVQPSGEGADGWAYRGGGLLMVGLALHFGVIILL